MSFKDQWEKNLKTDKFLADVHDNLFCFVLWRRGKVGGEGGVLECVCVAYRRPKVFHFLLLCGGILVWFCSIDQAVSDFIFFLFKTLPIKCFSI